MKQPEINFEPHSRNKIQEMVRRCKYTLEVELPQRKNKLLHLHEMEMLLMLSEILFWRGIYGDPLWDHKNGYSIQNVT